MLKIIQNKRNPGGDSVIIMDLAAQRMVFIHCSLLNLNRIFTRSLMSSLVVFFGILNGCSLVPNVSPTPSPPPSSFSDEEVTNYAQTVLKIEDQRRIAYDEIEAVIDNQPPEIACDQPETIKQLPEQAQKIAVQFCNESKKIAQDSGLSSNQFNAITENAQKDATLKKRIQNAMIRIRKP
ncbi:DUF4168 domain-containing protein [Cyanothece sp. BG0011]|uniref:DUF4168 domain-containing protein n=1 Tax=Cyanothece sp. BG0011 TaxID=2082950 RepID=UPI000D1F9980|nr:DUF4168 domain-containing protein [Cyanothece sp. BG0011]